MSNFWGSVQTRGGSAPGPLVTRLRLWRIWVKRSPNSPAGQRSRPSAGSHPQQPVSARRPIQLLDHHVAAPAQRRHGCDRICCACGLARHLPAWLLTGQGGRHAAGVADGQCARDKPSDNRHGRAQPALWARHRAACQCRTVGKERTWSMPKNLLTPQYTTCCDDMPMVRA